MFHQDFLNSFIERKQRIVKEIANVTVVWIPDLNYHKLLRTFALNFSKNYEKPRNRFKNSAAPRFFQPTSRCLDILMKPSFSCLGSGLKKRGAAEFFC